MSKGLRYALAWVVAVFLSVSYISFFTPLTTSVVRSVLAMDSEGRTSFAGRAIALWMSLVVARTVVRALLLKPAYSVPVAVTTMPGIGMATAHADDRHRAVHEAGHAVVADHLGLTVTKIDITINGDVGGITEYSGMVDNWAWIIVAVAGCVASHQSPGHVTGTSDYILARRHAEQVVTSGERPKGYDGPLEVEALLNTARQVAIVILHDKAELVARVAEELIEHGELTHTQVVELFR